MHIWIWVSPFFFFYNVFAYRIDCLPQPLGRTLWKALKHANTGKFFRGPTRKRTEALMSPEGKSAAGWSERLVRKSSNKNNRYVLSANMLSVAWLFLFLKKLLNNVTLAPQLFLIRSKTDLFLFSRQKKQAATVPLKLRIGNWHIMEYTFRAVTHSPGIIIWRVEVIHFHSSSCKSINVKLDGLERATRRGAVREEKLSSSKRKWLKQK